MSTLYARQSIDKIGRVSKRPQPVNIAMKKKITQQVMKGK